MIVRQLGEIIGKVGEDFFALPGTRGNWGLGLRPLLKHKTGIMNQRSVCRSIEARCEGSGRVCGKRFEARLVEPRGLNRLLTRSGFQFDHGPGNQPCKSCVSVPYAMCGYIKLERDGAGNAEQPHR